MAFAGANVLDLLEIRDVMADTPDTNLPQIIGTNVYRILLRTGD
ncbi:hypothetical protein [Sphingobacterium spiritivorum]